jgi:hypothetical protein
MLICGTCTEYESRKTDHIYPTRKVFYLLRHDTSSSKYHLSG